MDKLAIVRQIKIDHITDVTNPIITWFNDLWSKLHVMEVNVYHQNGGEFIYYRNEGGIKICIFFRDDINDKFWCDYHSYWGYLEHHYDLSHTDRQDITQILLNNILGVNVSTPKWGFLDRYEYISNSLKYKTNG